MATPRNHANSYLATKVMTASKEELRLMLLDGAVRFCTQGRDGLAAKNFEQAFNGFTRTRAIIVELMTTMQPDKSPGADNSLIEKLRSLYGYMLSRLITASFEKSVEAADEVIKLLGYERETWAMLMQTISAGNAAATSEVTEANLRATEQATAGFNAHG